MSDQYADILDFWFGDDEDDARVAADRGALWFGKSDKTDRLIAERFGELVRETAAAGCPERVGSARQRLAMIILLDQFPRNIYRGRPECFASDPLALQLALAGLDRAEDQQLRPIERVFFYLPLEHAEDRALQDRSVELFTALLETVPKKWRKVFAEFQDYAQRHREVILRFGRYPHRNAILDRISTPQEIAFLRQPGSSF